MSPWWTSYIVPNPQKGAQKRKVSKIWTIIIIIIIKAICNAQDPLKKAANEQ